MNDWLAFAVFFLLACLFVFTKAWPEEALASVAKYFLSGQAGLGIEPFIEPLGAMAVGIHRAVERETARSAAHPRVQAVFVLVLARHPSNYSVF